MATHTRPLKASAWKSHTPHSFTFLWPKIVKGSFKGQWSIPLACDPRWGAGGGWVWQQSENIWQLAQWLPKSNRYFFSTEIKISSLTELAQSPQFTSYLPCVRHTQGPYQHCLQSSAQSAEEKLLVLNEVTGSKRLNKLLKVAQLVSGEGVMWIQINVILKFALIPLQNLLTLWYK